MFKKGLGGGSTSCRGGSGLYSFGGGSSKFFAVTVQQNGGSRKVGNLTVHPQGDS